MAYEKQGFEKNGAPSYPGPPMSEPSGSFGSPAPDYNTPRVLHIYRDGITHRHMTITDEAKNLPLYKMDQNSGGIFSSKPHMTITQPSSPQNPVIGTATFHNWSRTIDLEVHGRAIPFQSEGIFTRSYAFSSPAFGDKLRWECDGIWGADLVLVNTKKEWLAKFDASLFSMSKTGKLHIVNGGINGVALDEIVVSGCAMVQHERRRRAASAGGGGGGG
ncbi:MAG: hypothetical protein Q9170_006957 [Blastenia crenularia]